MTSITFYAHKIHKLSSVLNVRRCEYDASRVTVLSVMRFQVDRDLRYYQHRGTYLRQMEKHDARRANDNGKLHDKNSFVWFGHHGF